MIYFLKMLLQVTKKKLNVEKEGEDVGVDEVVVKVVEVVKEVELLKLSKKL